jgi:hypothetical protein
VVLEKTVRSNKDHVMVDFSTLAIKGRASMGNIVTKGIVRSMSLAAKGGSTLGGRDVWFDRDILRLNYDKRGEYLGEFHNNDLVLVVLDYGDFYTTNFDATNHYEANILLIELIENHIEQEYALVICIPCHHDRGGPLMQTSSCLPQADPSVRQRQIPLSS